MICDPYLQISRNRLWGPAKSKSACASSQSLLTWGNYPRSCIEQFHVLVAVFTHLQTKSYLLALSCYKTKFTEKKQKKLHSLSQTLGPSVTCHIHPERAPNKSSCRTFPGSITLCHHRCNVMTSYWHCYEDTSTLCAHLWLIRNFTSSECRKIVL